MGHKMTPDEIKSGWIDNAIAYFAKLADENKDGLFRSGSESDMYNGKSFHEKVNGNMWNRSFYKWCAVNYQNRLVIYYKPDNNISFFTSKFAQDPPCFSIRATECSQPSLSNKDKETLEGIFNEICAKVSGMNNKIVQALTQCEQEFEIDMDTETMFGSIPAIEEKETESNNV